MGNNRIGMDASTRKDEGCSGTTVRRGGQGSLNSPATDKAAGAVAEFEKWYFDRFDNPQERHFEQCCAAWQASPVALCASLVKAMEAARDPITASALDLHWNAAIKHCIALTKDICGGK